MAWNSLQDNYINGLTSLYKSTSTEEVSLITVYIFDNSRNDPFIYLLLYVDDILIASKSKVEIGKLKLQLNEEFEMKNLGEAKKILLGL